MATKREWEVLDSLEHNQYDSEYLGNLISEYANNPLILASIVSKSDLLTAEQLLSLYQHRPHLQPLIVGHANFPKNKVLEAFTDKNEATRESAASNPILTDEDVAPFLLSTDERIIYGLAQNRNLTGGSLIRLYLANANDESRLILLVSLLLAHPNTPGQLFVKFLTDLSISYIPETVFKLMINCPQAPADALHWIIEYNFVDLVTKAEAALHPNAGVADIARVLEVISRDELKEIASKLEITFMEKSQKALFEAGYTRNEIDVLDLTIRCALF